MKDIGRRQFVSGAIGSAVVAGTIGHRSMSRAATQGSTPVPFQVFSDAQAETYSAWCDLLAIGAAKAGVAHYADQYIAGPYAKSLLLLRFFENPNLADFYLAGIAAIDAESQARFERPFVGLDKEARSTIVDAAAQSKTKAWTKPDPFFFYLVSRSDAVDVVYGTQTGFQDLGIAYLAHIEPDRPW